MICIIEFNNGTKRQLSRIKKVETVISHTFDKCGKQGADELLLVFHKTKEDRK